jgi:tricorn protease
VKIEWDGLDRRIQQLTRFASGSVVDVIPSPDSRMYAFVAYGDGGPGLYVIAEDGSRIVPVVQGAAPDFGQGGRRRGGGGFGIGDPQWSRDGRSIYFLQGGGLYAVSSPNVPSSAPSASPSPFAGRGGRGGRRGGGGSPIASAPMEGGQGGAAARRIGFTLRLEIDHARERQQVFEEAWRVMRNRFYDPNMHGVDWTAAKFEFEPLLSDLADTDELHNVIMEMIGELNASHTGISGGDSGGPGIPERVDTRYPGFDLAPDPSGYYKVSYIYKKGPADHDYIPLKVGNYILGVNGQPLKTSDNYWRLFNLLSGRKFEFAVNSKPTPDGARTVGLDPLSGPAQSELDYERWVDDRRDMVEKLSNGEIGYLHIRAMDAPSFDKFERDLLDNLDKKALIIDERFNGGGGIDQELLEVLNQRKKYEFWKGRNSVEIPRPVQAFFGPMCVLQNERSASNAEMFPEGFRTLGLGKIIGVPTYGAVIGTGAYRLLDGSLIRTPSFGVYTANGTNFENYGVQPDVWADNGPSDFLAGHDRQIEKAVEVLRSEMK